MFGELSLLYNVPRAASIKAKSYSILFCLDRDTFNHIVKNSAIKRREKYEKFIKSIKIFDNLEPYELGKLCDALKSKTYKKDEYIIKEGDMGQNFFLIMSGTAIATKMIKGEEIKVFEYNQNCK